MLTQVAVALAGLGWYALNLRGPAGPAPLGWLPNLCSAILAGGALLATGRGAHVNPAAARFWRYIGISTLLVGLGSLVRAVRAVRDPHAQFGPVDGAVYLCAVALEGWALLGLPLGLGTGRRQRAAGPVAPAGAAPGPRRSFSVLPYAAVAASNVLLLFVVISQDAGDRLGVAVGVVILAVLVMARQLLAFRDNSLLVERLDAGMVELGQRERRFRSLVQNGSDLITVTDANGILTYASPGTHRLLGSPPEDWIGRPTGEMLHAEDAGEVVEVYLRISGQPGATASVQARLAHADGSWRWAEITMANLLHDPGVAGIVGNARDVTDARDFQQRLHHQANHDALTDLANRTLFGERVSQALGAGPPDEVRVLLIDLNEFKTVNDTLGHVAGDALLVAAASRLGAAVRRGDLVARLGGDEFAILLEQADDTVAELVVARIAAAFEDPVAIDGRRLRATTSAGRNRRSSSRRTSSVMPSSTPRRVSPPRARAA